MDFSILKIFHIFGIVSAWATKAFEDGKVTLTEAVSLAIQLAALLGIPTQIDLPEEVTQDAGKVGESEAALGVMQPRAPQSVKPIVQE